MTQDYDIVEADQVEKGGKGYMIGRVVRRLTREPARLRLLWYQRDPWQLLSEGESGSDGRVRLVAKPVGDRPTHLVMAPLGTTSQMARRPPVEWDRSLSGPGK